MSAEATPSASARPGWAAKTALRADREVAWDRAREAQANLRKRVGKSAHAATKSRRSLETSNYQRWYRPNDGRYLSPDPIGLEGGEAGYFGYVGSNPGVWEDPDGELRLPAGAGGWGASGTQSICDRFPWICGDHGGPVACKKGDPNCRGGGDPQISWTCRATCQVDCGSGFIREQTFLGRGRTEGEACLNARSPIVTRCGLALPSTNCGKCVDCRDSST